MDDSLKVEEYLFVYKNGGWWLRINEPKQLFDYYEKTDSRWSDGFYNLITSKEFGNGENHANSLAYAIGTYGANRKLNAIEATQSFRVAVLSNQLDVLLKYHEIYINRNGGYHPNTSGRKDYSQFVRRKRLIFPEYKESDIRIKQFTGGEHWYAYIGDLQIKDGDIIKWNTYEEAYRKAKELISE